MSRRVSAVAEVAQVSKPAVSPTSRSATRVTVVLILTQLLIALGVTPTATALADSDRATLIARFDQLVVPAVAKAVRQPATDQGGEIAWGESYQLAALVEMLDVTRDPKYAELIVKLSDWIAKSRDDRQGLRD